MNIAVRVDASVRIGSGHVMRCLALAEVLREQGGTVLFIGRKHSGHLLDTIKKRGFQTYALSAPNGETESSGCDEYAVWLGVPWEQDADETSEFLKKKGVWDWLAVDHYGLDSRWEQRMRAVARRVLVIDDLANRKHDCDLLLDQNLIADMRTRYQNLTPRNCHLLLGPEHALLGSEYAALHRRIPPRSGPVQRLLIFFGGADPDNLTACALRALQRLDCANLAVDVVAGAMSPHYEALAELCRKLPNARLHGPLPSLAPLIARADLALGGGGATTWERCCLGLPSLVAAIAENQRASIEELHRRGVIRWIGDCNGVDERQIRQALAQILKEELSEEWSRFCFEQVDGLGTTRVAAVMTASEKTPVNARFARLEDEALLLHWANDSVTRRFSKSPGFISAEVHRKWFRRRLRETEQCWMFIIEAEKGVPVGQVRFDWKDEKLEIDYSVDVRFRGLGLGRSVLKAGISEMRQQAQQAPMIATVQEGNDASRRIFCALGFQEIENRPGIIRYMLS